MRWVTGLVLIVSLAGAAGPHAARGVMPDDDWEVLRERTRQAVSDAITGASMNGSAIVVGFTGGRQKPTNPSSGVVRLRQAVDAQYADRPDLTTHAYNNRHWKHAADAVLTQVRASVGPPPLIVVYGHSLGGGSVTKFARELQRERVDVTLAIYVDTVSIRNPRVPGNVQFAVNLYQRNGLLRGLPLRGKRVLVLEDAVRTEVLGNLRIRPQTRRFGWNWNLVQPLFYRQHIRMGHDERLQGYVIDVLSLGVAEAGLMLEAIDPR